MTPSSVAEIKPWSKNPRTISTQQLEALKRSMDAHGDLGGVVFNIRSRHTVGGHQRIKVLDPSWKIEKHAESDKTGTVARGFIITPFGKFSYREVDWPLRKEMTANLAANKIQGEWDFEKLTPILKELHDLPELDLTGFTLKEADIVISHGDAWNDPKDEETPSLPAKSMVKLGEIWQLGEHRLLRWVRVHDYRRREAPSQGVLHGAQSSLLPRHNQTLGAVDRKEGRAKCQLENEREPEISRYAYRGGLRHLNSSEPSNSGLWLRKPYLKTCRLN